MKIVLLDGNRIEDISDLHKAFSEALSFPDWYGGNLDALYDLLTESAEETGVIVANEARLKKALGKRWTPFLRLMRDICEQRQGFYFTRDPFKLK